MARLNQAPRTPPSLASRRARGKSGFTPLQLLGLAIFLLLPLLPIALWSTSSKLNIHLKLLQFLPSPLLTYFSPRTTLPPNPAADLANVDPEDPALLEACRKHTSTTEIISLDPLLVYINNFTSAAEAEALIKLGYATTLPSSHSSSIQHPPPFATLPPTLFNPPPHSSPDFAPSFISRSHGPNTKVTGRTSESAPLELDHPLVSCILTRARRFMGSTLLPHEPFSIPQLVRYHPTQRYDLHTDFWPTHQIMKDGSGRLFNRPASFFVFLRDNCTEGETYFPLVDVLDGEDGRGGDLEGLFGGKVLRGGREGVQGEEGGVKFRPIRGNAVFWVNIDGEGVGDRRVVHAGLPVGSGEKIGLNLWPRKFYGWRE
ncbi:hypothetical protein K458DRAFT_408161 [Lentithecium fluviatile CBS 122367]|uniref:Fe2OG dioxygenase domain-containing protein n=1 Tax=Lentithecium fluviatile CBS 122367 TaxID=1168545 RepID=A0A6G1IMT8_9PLEO|nr:hypothetical protein K458DRAFT_408161 [Lentithecium fluviatile CBS 122367]